MADIEINRRKSLGRKSAAGFDFPSTTNRARKPRVIPLLNQRLELLRGTQPHDKLQPRADHEFADRGLWIIG